MNIPLVGSTTQPRNLVVVLALFHSLLPHPFPSPILTSYDRPTVLLQLLHPGGAFFFALLFTRYWCIFFRHMLSAQSDSSVALMEWTAFKQMSVSKVIGFPCPSSIMWGHCSGVGPTFAGSWNLARMEFEPVTLQQIRKLTSSPLYLDTLTNDFSSLCASHALVVIGTLSGNFQQFKIIFNPQTVIA